MRTSIVAVAVAAVLGLATSVSAATIQIELGGVNLGYDGSSLFDADPGLADPDPLTTVNFLVDGAPAGPVLVADIALDVFIPDVSGIGVLGDTVTSAAGGIFDLLLPGGDLLEIDLAEALITYSPIGGLVQFLFGGAVGTIASQSLPFGLALGDSVSISFSTQVDAGTLSDDGQVLTGFTSSGTGEIRGVAVPEVAALWMLVPALGALALGRRTRA